MPTVLIVDDHPLMAQGAATLIESLGCDAAVAVSGEAALEVIHSKPVDLVVLDVTMPGMSGLDVLRKLAMGGIVPRLPVLMFSATGVASREALKLGAVGFVFKGDPDCLIDSVREHLPRSGHSMRCSR